AQTIANYSLSKGAGTPLTAVIGAASNVVNLTYVNDFTSGEYTLTVHAVADIKGNSIATAIAKNFIYVEPYSAKKGDVVFNEIMAAPISTATTLNKEYVELYNTTDKYIIITGWKYKDGSTTTATFAADTLAPKTYRILCANADVDQYKVYGKTLGLSSWPTLNNDKDDLNLFLPDGTTVIDFVSYTDAWYQDNTKRTGYALELINLKSSCPGAPNWIASTATIGGTPGAQNSVSAELDPIAPKLIGLEVLSTTSVRIDFDKTIQSDALSLPSNYSFNNGIGVPISAVPVSTLNKSVVLTLATPIARGVESLLTVTNLISCGDVLIDPSHTTAKIFLAKEIKPNDILISEVLFNERTGGAEFVEIYNATNDILNLKDLQISNASYTSANDKKAITVTSIFIQPKTYWVLSRNPEAVKQQYEVKYPQQMVQVASLPTYTNTAGSVKLWKVDELIDDLSYTEKMHHALLKEVKGVSLERVSFTKSANEPGNLQSAAASAGFATPTYKNSHSEDTSVKNAMAVANKTFSPDNDGFEDLLQIDYRFKENGNLATINIYTDKGILVRKLARNITMSTQGSIYWDGLNDAGQLCKVGIYIVRTTVFNINGNSDSFKQTCVLASKLN
ncbi:lamin tail domain-containing protein, partial [Pedobacter sp.]